MKRAPAILIGLAMLLGFTTLRSPANAQAPKADPARAGLDVYVGTWEFDWELKPSMWGPGGKMTGTESYEWLPGGFFLQMQRDARGSGGSAAPTGTFRSIIVFGYDRAAEAYTAQWFTLSDGGFGSATVKAEGGRRLWSGAGQMGDGTPFHERCTRMVASDGASMTITCEVSSDGLMWSPALEGTYRKRQ